MEDEKIVGWIEEANEDLEVSKLLFSNNHFKKSYFHFQQATEKAVKGLCLFGSLIDENDLRNFSHDTLKIFLHIMKSNDKEYDKLIRVDDVIFDKIYTESIGISKDHLIELRDETSRLESFCSLVKKDGIVILEPDFFKRVIEEINERKNIYLKCIDLKIDRTELRENLINFLTLETSINYFNGIPESELIQRLEKVGSQFENVETREQFIKESKLFIITREKLVYASLVLFHCATLTVHAANNTRYPNPKTKSLYSKDNEIIKYHPIMLGYLQEAIELIESAVKSGK
jgi:HEPN domain-containing protein